MADRLSAIALGLAAGGRDGAAGGRAVKLTELRGWHLTQLAAFAGRDAALAECLRERLKLTSLPPPGVSLAVGPSLLFHTAPRQYWVVTSDAAIDAAWATVLAPSDGTATPLSHARVRLALEGQSARTVLEKGISADLRPESFRVGDFLQAGLHHTGILVHRAAESRYELYLPRSFAATLWEWLTDAARPTGYEVGQSIQEHHRA